MKTPIVYRFVCPDGRSYVGSVRDSQPRAHAGIARKNARLLAAFEQHPPETWTYEILEQLPVGCSERELREAEQRHINALRSWTSELGFNVRPAVWCSEAVQQRQQERVLQTRNWYRAWQTSRERQAP